jgi:ComF family protein
MWNTFLDLFFPRRSLSGQEGEWITAAERRRLATFPVVEETEHLRKRGLRFLDHLLAASTYRASPLLKKAIHTFKYGRATGLDLELAALVLRCVPPGSEWSKPVLCPVPLHWTRQFARGFNQAERIARIVAEQQGYTMLHLLKRVRATGSQARRNRAERLTAVADAFRCVVSDPPARVILVDDLSTTGATLDACAKALKEAGVKHVGAWVIAHDQ